MGFSQVFLVLNLSFGLAGFVALEAFKTSVEQTLQANAAELLSADLSVSARRRFSNSEIETLQSNLPANTQVSRRLDFYSMAANKDKVRLVQIRAVDSHYPLVGKIRLASGLGDSSELQTSAKIWCEPDVLRQLELKVGDSLRLGDRDFNIAGLIVDDATKGMRVGGVGSLIYVGYEMIKGSPLLTEGSTLTEEFFVHDIKNQQVDYKNLKKLLLDKFEDPAIQVKTAQDSSEDTGRILAYLSDYLGLSALAALFLACLGAGFLLRSFLRERSRTLAIYNVLGLSFNKSFLYLLGQSVILGFISSSVALGIAIVVLPLLQRSLQDFMPHSVVVTFQNSTVLINFGVGILVSGFLAGPLLWPLKKLPLVNLLRDREQIDIQFGFKDSLLFMPSLLLFWSLSVFESHSFKVGSLFFVSLLGSLLVILLAAKALLQGLRVFKTSNQYWPLKQVILILERKFSSVAIALLALTLATLLMSLIPQLKTGLQADLKEPVSGKLPAYFLFDIQDEQVLPLQELHQRQKIAWNSPSAMIRARLIEVNDKKFEKKLPMNGPRTREEETEARFRNRGFNLSYRSGLTPSETLVEGTEFHGTYDGKETPQISVEKGFAKRLGFEIGDRLKFDIQGTEIEGRIVNFRSVEWNSFQPNFFVIFQPGVLEDAPKTWLAAVPQKNLSASYLAELGKEFPNISAIDVQKVIENLFSLLEKISVSMQFMAALSFLTGIIVLASIVRQHIQSQTRDLALLKVLGASEISLQIYFFLELGILSLVAGILGVSLSLLVSWILAKFLFDSVYAIDSLSAFLTLFVTVLASLILAWWAARRVSKSLRGIRDLLF
jgi:putative ABC transport system permease protein